MAFLIVICSLLACNKEEVKLTQEEEGRELNEIASRIIAITESISCEDASEWAYVGFGSKPCGGPSGYIAYPVNINTPQFLALVEQYRQAQMSYNQNWGLVSNCMIEPAPSDIICEDGRPVLVY